MTDIFDKELHLAYAMWFKTDLIAEGNRFKKCSYECISFFIHISQGCFKILVCKWRLNFFCFLNLQHNCS